MQIKASSAQEYLQQIPIERQECIQKLRNVINTNLPDGFEETMSYGMIGYVVPHRIYSKGYHCDPKLPLPFMSLASQKNFVALYHMGIYAVPKIYDWFVKEYPKHAKRKLDIGKSCIRFKNIEDIPYGLIGELSTKLNVQDWIEVYEKNIVK